MPVNTKLLREGHANWVAKKRAEKAADDAFLSSEDRRLKRKAKKQREALQREQYRATLENECIGGMVRNVKKIGGKTKLVIGIEGKPVRRVW